MVKNTGSVKMCVQNNIVDFLQHMNLTGTVEIFYNGILCLTPESKLR